MLSTKNIIGLLTLSYRKQTVPDDVKDNLVKRFQTERKKAIKRRLAKHSGRTVLGIFGLFALLFAVVNLVPAVGQATDKLPLIGPTVAFLTVQERQINSGHQKSSVRTAKLDSTAPLATMLNQKYLAQAKQAYETYQKEVGADPDDYYALDTRYKKLTDDSRFLVIQYSVTQSKGSTSDTVSFDTIDKQHNVLLSLPLLFKNSDYIATISKEIKRQIAAANELSDGTTYWTDANANSVTPFAAITKKQKFYINAAHQLVIVFDKYEIGPGASGTPEFIIPTALIQKLLVNSDYLS